VRGILASPERITPGFLDAWKAGRTTAIVAWNQTEATVDALLVSDSVRKCATLSVRWEPPDRLRRESIEGALKEE
jgi:hypothetical protein